MKDFVMLCLCNNTLLKGEQHAHNLVVIVTGVSIKTYISESLTFHSNIWLNKCIVMTTIVHLLPQLHLFFQFSSLKQIVRAE